MKCRKVNPKLSPCLFKYKLRGPRLPGGSVTIPGGRTCKQNEIMRIS